MGALWDEWFTPPDATTIKYKVRTIIGRYGYREADAEDLEQRLAIQAWKAMHQHDPKKAKRSTFLKTVLENEAANIIAHDTAEKRDRRRERPLEAAGEGPVFEGTAEQSNVDRQRDIAAMIARLPEDLRTTAKLLMVMSPAEAARQTGMTRGKVRQQATQIARYFREFGWESG